jgi:Ca2+-binding EF-hand superfamily protein
MKACVWIITFFLISQASGQSPPPERTRQSASHAPAKAPEVLRMLGSILVKGAEMDGTTGWFGPGLKERDWSWLAARYDADGDQLIRAKEFPDEHAFRVLDRDRSGAISADDLDWSEQSPFVRRFQMTRRTFGQIDRDSNGRITPEEWRKAFDRVAGQKGFVTIDDLAGMVMPLQPSKREQELMAKQGPPPGEMPSRATLLKGLWSGEIGSWTEGPGLGEKGPDFTLWTHDRERLIQLSEVQQSGKPVVLIFGSFT